MSLFREFARLSTFGEVQRTIIPRGNVRHLRLLAAGAVTMVFLAPVGLANGAAPKAVKVVTAKAVLDDLRSDGKAALHNVRVIGPMVLEGDEGEFELVAVFQDGLVGKVSMTERIQLQLRDVRFDDVVSLVGENCARRGRSAAGSTPCRGWPARGRGSSREIAHACEGTVVGAMAVNGASVSTSPPRSAGSSLERSSPTVERGARARRPRARHGARRHDASDRRDGRAQTAGEARHRPSGPLPQCANRASATTQSDRSSSTAAWRQTH
jgi:hypothetical protein